MLDDRELQVEQGVVEPNRREGTINFEPTIGDRRLLDSRKRKAHEGRVFYTAQQSLT